MSKNENTLPDNDIIAAPTVSTAPSGEVPKAVYVARVTKATDGKSQTSQLRMITFDCEIVAPDVVESQLAPGTACQVAGRKFRMYATIDPTSKGFSGGHALLGKLMLLTETGDIRPSHVINTANVGNIFFQVVLEGEQDYHRLPKRAGQTVGDIMMFPGTNTPMTRGFRMSLPGEQEIISRVHEPEGFIAQMR